MLSVHLDAGKVEVRQTPRPERAEGFGTRGMRNAIGAYDPERLIMKH
jgi:hypothetical protein